MRQYSSVVFPVSLLLLVVFANVVATQSIPMLSSRDDARTVIDGANQALLVAFRNVLAAESAGADVAALVEKLNLALNLLAQARESYAAGDYANALGFSSRSKEISDGVILEAEQLKSEAERMSQVRAVAFFVGVPVVLLALAVVGYYGYKMFRRRSVEDIMKKRIKVSGKEEE